MYWQLENSPQIPDTKDNKVYSYLWPMFSHNSEVEIGLMEIKFPVYIWYVHIQTTVVGCMTRVKTWFVTPWLYEMESKEEEEKVYKLKKLGDGPPWRNKADKRTGFVYYFPKTNPQNELDLDH